MKAITASHCVFACLLIVACSNEDEEPPLFPSTRTPPALSPTASKSYQLNAFEFPIDEPASIFTAPSEVRTVGASSVLVRHNNTGGVIGWSQPQAAWMNAGWPADQATHDAMARAYILRQGIPGAELGTMFHFRGAAESAPIAQPGQVTRVELGYSAVFTRVVHGIEVPDSRAGVQLNAAGVPVAISIVWPDVPSAIISAADALSQVTWTFPSPARAAIGAPLGKSRVVIRHSVSGASSLRWRVVRRTELLGNRLSFIETDDFGQRLSDPDIRDTSTGTR